MKKLRNERSRILKKRRRMISYLSIGKDGERREKHQKKERARERDQRSEEGEGKIAPEKRCAKYKITREDCSVNL